MQIQKPKQGYKLVKSLFGKYGEIPEDWDIDEIQNHTKITTGSKNTQDKIEDGKFPFFVRSQKIERINSYSYNGEAILTAGDGVGTGKVFHYINGKFDFHQRVYKISDFDKSLNGYFFYLYFSNYFLYRVRSMSAKNSVDSVRMDMIAKMLIPLPALKEQQKIALILSNVDSLIQHTQQIIEQTQKLKKGLMQRLLTKGIGHTKFKKLRIGVVKYEIPDEWEENKLEDLSNKIADGLHSTPEYVDDSTFYFINGNNLNNGKIVLNNAKNVDENEYLKYKTNLNENTVLLSINGTIGNVAFYDNEKVMLGKSVCYINCTEKLNKKFLFYFLQSDYWNKYITKELTSTTISNLSLASIRNLPIPTPKISEQHKIASILSDINSSVQKQQEYKSKLEILKKGLMQKLLTGQIRVKI